MPKDPRIKKVLVIGSGPIIIGQAAEFDYSGTQACRALKAEGIETVLLNSNPATIMTDPDVADHVYIEPMTLEVVERILDIEKPDSVLPNLGGQMGLNLSMELARSGYLDRTGIRLLACKPETIDRAEDRELFKETMEKLHQPIIPSEVVETLEDALACADRIGYPVIVRPAFTMGGTGGGICENKAKLIEIGTNGLRLSPIHQILVEKCIAGWKEIEYEVMRDHKGNVITVCNMENLDPVGIHTGDSVVVAPSQTLTDHEYQMLRTAALDIITELGIEGGCNCQFALKPDSFDYAVIEVNPRVSRSSALASKATGYPIAKVATKIAIGYTLDEITNDVTGKTCACFEPALDYIVVKYPKWPFDKFVYADKSLGTQMMATGEVMAIGNNFEHAMMKAVSSTELGLDTMTLPDFEKLTTDEVIEHLHVQDSERAFCVYEALKRGVPHETIYDITKIDWWFLDKLQHLADIEMGLKNGELTTEKYLNAKRFGFLDKTIRRLADVDTLPEAPKAAFKMVDTCAAEFAAKTPYFYSTYDEDNEAAQFIAERSDPNKKKVLVFGSGPIRIGQGIEFDYCSVHAVWTLKQHGCEAVLVNNNPETVSTDFDTADRLYFEPLTAEDVGAVEAGSGVYLKALTVQGNTMTVTKGDGSTETVMLAQEYVLPAATADALGGVKVGDYLDVDEDGTLSGKTLNDKIAAAVAVKSEARLVWNTHVTSPNKFTTWDVQIPDNVDKMCITKGRSSSSGNNTEKSIARGGTTTYDCNYDFTITFQTNGILHVVYPYKTVFPLELWIDGYHYPTLADLLTQVTAVESSVTDLQVALCELYEEKEEN